MANSLADIMDCFNMGELSLLEMKARQFTGNDSCEITSLYRNKPKDYFDEILEQGGIMSPCKKDGGGDPKCPINKKISGLFFFGKLWHNVSPPDRSPFGDTRIFIPVSKLFTRDHHLYFADFFCMSRWGNPEENAHYITTVVTKENSDADRFCKKHLVKLDICNNPYMWLSNDDESCYMAQGDKVWVEVFYTEPINIKAGPDSNEFSWTTTEVLGTGQSKPNGVPKNSNCKTCNLTN